MASGAGLFDRIANDVCRRAFSSPESIAYEVGIAPGVYRVVAPLIKARVTSDPVLDVGCGGGRLTIDLAQVLKRTVVGLDLAVLQVRRLARHAGRSRAVAAVRASAEQLPFPDRCFGAVISSC